MSGVVSVGAAIGATALAASSVASVGLTVGSAFAIMGAVGATLGAVGYFAKSKELQIAGAAIGAVGLVGGLASAAGMFGTAGSLFGSGMQTAGVGAEAAQAASAAAESGGLWANVAPAAVSAGSSAPTTGYGALAGSFETGGVAGQVDAISMVNGIEAAPLTAAAPNVAPSTAMAPDVTPAAAGDTVASSQLPAYESPTKNFDLSPIETPPLPEASPVSGEVANPGRSLLNGDQSLIPKPGEFSPIPVEQNMSPAQIDPSGRIIPQGDVPAGPTEWTNPAAPGAGFNEPAPVTGAPEPAGIAGAGNTPPSATGAMQQQTPLIDAGSAQAASSAAAPTQWGGTAPGKLAAPESAWSGVLNFVKNNQTLSYGAIQTFGSFISGAMGKDESPELAAELAARRQQNEAAARLYDTQREMLQRRMDNMNQSVPVASRQSYGLINGGAAVTGRIG